MFSKLHSAGSGLNPVASLDVPYIDLSNPIAGLGYLLPILQTVPYPLYPVPL
jgi:hypothetical protein